MQINCSSCERPINIPDEKLPKDKAVSVTCPSCKNKIKIDQHLQSPAKENPPAETEAAQKSTIDTSALIENPEFEEEETVFYGENDRVALILDDKNKDTWSKDLEIMGYKLQYAKSPDHAAHKLKFIKFHLIALHENFANVPLDQNVFYQSLLELPMSVRRKIFVALVGNNFKTLHNMQAFAASVNMVINQKDMGQLPQILKAAISENEIFYKVFKETLTAIGKI